MSLRLKSSSPNSKKSQMRHIKKIVLQKPKLNGNILVKKSPTIIRIVPNNTKPSNVKKKTTDEETDTVQAFIVQRSNNVKSVPSTSTVQALGDHEYICKKEYETDCNDMDFQDYNDMDFDKVKCNEPVITNNNVESQNKETQKSKPEKLINHTINDTHASDIVTIPEKLNKVHSEQCCCSCRETLNLILEQQQEILKYIKNSHQTLKPVETKLDLLPPMPFNDLNDFLDFDESLAHENVRNQFIIKLKKLLVSMEQKSVSNILSSIMTNELCKKISWIGIKNTLEFGATNMVDIIVDLILEHHNIDIDVAKSRIADWLRRCSDRIGNEIRKNKRKEQRAAPT